MNLLNFCGDRLGNKQATYKNYELTIRRVWDFVSLTTHPSDTLRRLFMRGVEITNPTVPRYEDVFDISILLKYVEENLINSDLTIHLRDACILFFRIFKLNRSSEVAHIMLRELDWDSDSYKWLGEKTHVGRIMSGEVALPAAYQQFDIRPLLKKYLKRRRASLSEYLFSGATPGTWNKPLSVDRIRNICKEHMKKAGIDVSKYKPHSIRHASASALIMAGATLDQVMALGRWKSLSTFLKYYLKQRPTINVAALLSG